jgi:hypothetical protein
MRGLKSTTNICRTDDGLGRCAASAPWHDRKRFSLARRERPRPAPDRPKRTISDVGSLGNPPIRRNTNPHTCLAPAFNSAVYEQLTSID